MLAVTVSTDVDDLIDHAREVFRNSRAQLADLLAAAGVAPDAAAKFATIAVAGAEGAVVLARAERSILPFDEVAENLLDQARTLPRA